MSPQRKGVSTRETVSVFPWNAGPARRPPGRWGRHSSWGRFVLVAVVEDGLEVTGQTCRWGDEREASTHESCIVTQWHLRRGLVPRQVSWPGPFSSMGGRRYLSVVYEHMFAFGQQKGLRLVPGSSRSGWPIGFVLQPVAGRLLPVPAPLAPLFPTGRCDGDDDDRGRVAGSRRHHAGAGFPGCGVAGGELVCGGRPPLPGWWPPPNRHRSAPGGLRATSGDWLGRSGGRPVARRRRRPGPSARPGPPDRSPPPARPGPGPPGGAGGAGGPPRRVARRR